MVQKRGEVENILKVSFPGPILVRKGSGNDVFLTRSRDEIVLDIEKRDVKPLYWDQVTAHFSDLTPPGFRSGIFPPKCDRGSIEILCGQDQCQAYVVGESVPVSVLPPTIISDPPECPNPPCTPCPQQCEDGTCPPCAPPPLPCPCTGDPENNPNLAPIGAVHPNCPPNPCGSGCPCPNGGCPPCTGCVDNQPLCPDGTCPPCTGCDAGVEECCNQPGACPAAGSECCMCDRSGHCMTVTTFQWGFTTQGPRCPIGVNGLGDEATPVYEGEFEFLCVDSCQCPCASSGSDPCNIPNGDSKTSLRLCNTTTRTFCNSSDGTNIFSSSDGLGGSIELDFNTGMLNLGGLDFSDLPPANDTLIPGDTPRSGVPYLDTPCGESSGGAPCFCRCCVRPGSCDGVPLCGGCPDDAPSAPNRGSMCTPDGGTNIVYRRMCSSPGIDFCAVRNNGGDCQQNTGECSAVPTVIVSWYPIVNVDVIRGPEDTVLGFDISLSGNPVGGPGSQGGCDCTPNHGTSTATASGDFDDLYPDATGFNNPEWPNNNIADECEE